MSIVQSTSQLAIINGFLRTNTPSHQDATAIYIREGVITAIGSNEEILDQVTDSTQVVNVQGGTVSPGLWDSHAHPDSGAVSTRGTDLGGLTTITQLRQALKEQHAQLPPEQWLEGWNLEYEMFEEAGIDRSAFEDITQERPVFLRFYDGHTGLASLSALQAAGVNDPVRYPDGSETVTDSTGRFTGELCEMSILSFMTQAVPVPSLEQELQRLENIFLSFARTGLTGCAVMDGSPKTRELLTELERQNRLPQRIVVHEWHKVHYSDEDQDRIISAKNESGRLWEGSAVKLFSDGVIDTGTAYLHSPDCCGDGEKLAWPDWERFKQVLNKYHQAGFYIATHAVGDHAVSRVLDAYADLPPRKASLPPHSIEHLEIMSDDDVRKLGRSGITASMQPLHMQWRSIDLSDNWSQRLGSPRSSTGYRCKSAIQAGARVVLGSDWPVASYDPRVGMAWARGRQNPQGNEQQPFEPEEALTGEEALQAYTLWPAQARGWHNRGHISVGALGDLTVFEKDPVAADPHELPNIPILMTIVDGGIVYWNDSLLS